METRTDLNCAGKWRVLFFVEQNAVGNFREEKENLILIIKAEILWNEAAEHSRHTNKPHPAKHHLYSCYSL
jgi:hypothetical protein